MNNRDAAQLVCEKIIEAGEGMNIAEQCQTSLALDIQLDGATYDAVLNVDGLRGEPFNEEVQLDDCIFPCVGFSIQKNTAVFECIDPMESKLFKKVMLKAVIDAIQQFGIDNIQNGVVKMHVKDGIDAANIASLEYGDVAIRRDADHKKVAVVSYVNLDRVLDLNDMPSIEKLALQKYQYDIDYAEDASKLGKRFYEDDGGACAGDAGAPAAGCDAGDIAAEMNGTSVADVLGTCKPGEGYMGKDNFYIPARAKVPLHHWEAANGGSKRKKDKHGKPKKYDYEKGMKVVVSMFEDDEDSEMLNEWEKKNNTFKYLRGKSWQEVVSDSKKMETEPPAYERWEAAQLPMPDEDQHGPLGGCIIDDDVYKRNYLSEYFIHGFYQDGTVFELGPMKRKVAAEYLSLHQLSVNSRAWQQMADRNFSDIHVIGKYDDQELRIAKFKDGYWLVDGLGKFKAGPFSNKQLARIYAKVNSMSLEKGSHGEKSDEGYRLEYPAFAFSYTMMGVPCMDVVVAEDMPRAMKLFDLQWRSFDNTRPVKEKFNTVQDLQRDLSLLRIKDIEVSQIDPSEVDEYQELADETGNPSTIDKLQSKCRNPRFRYFLGKDNAKGSRLVIPKFY